MVARSYSPRDFVVGAANAHTSAAVRPMNWSATTSSLPGDPLPSHCAEAWNAVHPFGTVTEYPYVSDAKGTRGDSDGVGDVTVLAEGVDPSAGIHALRSSPRPAKPASAITA